MDKVKFNWEINLGQTIAAVTLLMAAAGAFYGLKSNDAEERAARILEDTRLAGQIQTVASDQKDTARFLREIQIAQQEAERERHRMELEMRDSN